MYACVIVGAGFAGAVCARKLAEDFGYNVLLIEERNTIGGNMYDYYDQNGILIHKYGPHIMATMSKEVFDFLLRFSEWHPYHHEVKAEIDGLLIPLPINFKSIDFLYPPYQASSLKKILLQQFGDRENVTIQELLNSSEVEIRSFAEHVYEKVFVHYSEKMWGQKCETIDASVMARVPVRLSYDTRYFQKWFQYMPDMGYTKLFERMLDHPKITVKLGCKSEDVIRIDTEANKIMLDNELLANDVVIYTGALDRLFQYQYGELPYRTIAFKHETHHKDYVQDVAVVNYPDSRPATRRTEMKLLTGQTKEGVTSTVTEYPHAFVKDNPMYCEPYYPIQNASNSELYEKYRDLASRHTGLFIVGRLAEYRYYNMDDVILRALTMVNDIADYIAQSN